MKENRINALTSIVFLLAALVMLAALSLTIGKWSFGGKHYTLTIEFPNATGISANSQVKYAGAPVGRVTAVRLIPRANQKTDPATGKFNCIDVDIELDQDLEISQDTTAIIKQDGIGIAAKYVLLTPGPDRNSPVLADGSVMQGQTPYDLADLIQPAGNALAQAGMLITKLGPVLDRVGPAFDRLDSLSQRLETDLPPLMAHADKFMNDGDSVLANFSTPEGRARLDAMLDSLRVSTENLKVVSSNAKALTATLAQKPWRVFWGGPTVEPPTESAVLKSDKVIRLKPDVEINNPANKNSSQEP